MHSYLHKIFLLVKSGCYNNREHDDYDSLHSVEVAQLYPQVGDFIAS
jgi:hypothetical protein